MEEKAPEKRWGRLGWILAASVAIHLLVLLAFLVKLPAQPDPAKEDAVQVSIVPPPDDPKPEEKKPDEKKVAEAKPPAPEKKAEPEKRAEKTPEAPPPPPAKTPDKQEGQQTPPPPEKKPEQPKDSPPPPPPPPEKQAQKQPDPPKAPEQKPPEQAKAPEQEKPPEPPKPADPPKEAKAEPPPPQPEKQPDQPPPPSPEETSQPPMPAQPVFHFGDKDQGPRKSLDGDSADDTADAGPDTASAADAAGASPPASDTPSDKPDEEAQSASPVDKDINLPEVKTDDAHPETDGAPSEGDGNVKAAFAPERKTDQGVPSKGRAEPGAKAAADGQVGTGPKLKKARKLFSTSENGGLSAMAAIGDMPRDARFRLLCQSEAAAQLFHNSPSYRPSIVTLAKPAGTVMTVEGGAFRDPRGWYSIDLRCEVDSDVTKVVSFSFNVGNPIPRSQWHSRGFPAD